MGVFIYELLVGVTPFYSKDTSRMYSRACSGNVSYPRQDRRDCQLSCSYLTLEVCHLSPRRLSKSAVHLISRMLKVDPTRRIGNLYNGSRDIKYHSWFSTVDWVRLYERKDDSPWKPNLNGPLDTQYFETFPFKGLDESPYEQFAADFENF